MPGMDHMVMLVLDMGVLDMQVLAMEAMATVVSAMAEATGRDLLMLSQRLMLMPGMVLMAMLLHMLVTLPMDLEAMAMATLDLAMELAMAMVAMEAMEPSGANLQQLCIQRRMVILHLHCSQIP